MLLYVHNSFFSFLGDKYHFPFSFFFSKKIVCDGMKTSSPSSHLSNLKSPPSPLLTLFLKKLIESLRLVAQLRLIKTSWSKYCSTYFTQIKRKRNHLAGRAHTVVTKYFSYESFIYTCDTILSIIQKFLINENLYERTKSFFTL